MRKISYSQLSTYIECPYKWNLIYQQKIQERVYRIQSIFGTAMHQTIQTFLYNYYNKTISQSKKTDYFDMLKQNIIINYNLDLQKNQNKQIATFEQLMQIYEEGKSILEQLISKSNKYFKKKNTKLIGTQIQLNYKFSQFQDIYFLGLIDILVFDTKENIYKIIDIKTSKYKWDDKKKKDYTKRLQLILYKYFLSKEKNINLQNIEVQFLILKRKVFDSQFKVSRIQRFVPPNSSRTCSSTYSHIIQIIKDILNSIESNVFIKKPSQSNCRFCLAVDRLDLCDRKNTQKI